MILAWLLLLTGLTISAVAIYYSVVGLTAIFSAAVIPIIIMGSALEVGKLVCASWLKENWERAPRFMKYYMISAVMVLMLITSMGIFGFLSKAHNDQNLVSGDVQSKIAIYDEKIKTAKENIEANRKQLKQMDEAVDQVMGRSTDEKGADKANNIRKSQQRDRSALAKDIEANQKLIAKLNDEAAPIRAEVRKVEAEVGPIKYIAAFVYGDNPDANVLEKAVTWVIIIIVSVFDPLAVILLLASQYSFQWFRKAREDEDLVHSTVPLHVVAEEPKAEEIAPVPEEKSILEQHPYLAQPFSHFKNLTPIVHKPEPVVEEKTDPLEQWNKMLEAAEEEVAKEKTAEEILDEGLNAPTFQLIPELQEELKKAEWPTNPEKGDRCIMFLDGANRNFIFNGTVWIDADKSDQTSVAVLDESKKKINYMIKEQDQQVLKTRE